MCISTFFFSPHFVSLSCRSLLRQTEQTGPSFFCPPHACSPHCHLKDSTTTVRHNFSEDCSVLRLAKMVEQASSLVSHKSSDSGLHVLLHPLVLLTISDHITRHVARQQKGPIVGALLGRQQGRDISLEHAFECSLLTEENGDVVLHHTWFEQRLKECKFSRYTWA